MRTKIHIASFFFFICTLCHAQTAYFVDGYHGGVYGHYPRWKTKFIVDQLRKHPEWKINLEIEPETWDSVRSYDPEAYSAFKNALNDPSFSERIEFVNPSYGQSYLFNISGESVIRQFAYGIHSTLSHFPTLQFLTYSSEEPCFTSSLPQILTSFGFRYAVLKNPNTCWGGYTRAYGGEKIKWVGPDGTTIPTVPRYGVEQFEKGSTWQTTAWANADTYIKKCLDDGIRHPVGMCLQDAGWKGGPWLGIAKATYRPSVYTLWRDYFQKVIVNTQSESWKLSQEDIRVSLVWGSQVLQKLAQQVRASENKIIQSEKIASMRSLEKGIPYPGARFDEAWRTLLLSQHHDCWIVPYNGKRGHTWADKTKAWTDRTNAISDSIVSVSISRDEAVHSKFIRVYNTTASPRRDVVSVKLPFDDENVGVADGEGNSIRSQVVIDEVSKTKELLFIGEVPPTGYSTYRIVALKKPASDTRSVTKKKDQYTIRNGLYTIVVDGARGGIITSIRSVATGNKEFVDADHERGFNELRGHFYELNKDLSSADQPATIRVLEEGPVRIRLEINGQIGEHPFRQLMILHQNDPKIEFDLTLDWKGNPGIGKYSQVTNFKAEDPEKAFYNDRYKLQALFPMNMSSPKVFKDAPFDVTESTLKNTYFNRWDSIKNNVVLSWVDVEESSGASGLSLFTDHTTSYGFDGVNVLGLTLQYSGVGLWGRNYSITGPSQIHYALVPHAGRWDVAGIPMIASQIREPLVAAVVDDAQQPLTRSFLSLSKPGWEVSSMQMDGRDVTLRIFNASGDDASGDVIVDGVLADAGLEELNGRSIRTLAIDRKGGKSRISLSMPRFGIRTIKLRTK